MSAGYLRKHPQLRAGAQKEIQVAGVHGDSGDRMVRRRNLWEETRRRKLALSTTCGTALGEFDDVWPE